MKFPRYRIVTTFHNGYYIAQGQYADDQGWYDVIPATDNLVELEQQLKEMIDKRDFEPVVIKEFN